MREIVLDTETTGLDPASGDRIVEIGCIELVDHFPTGAEYHAYLNPERDMPPDAERVHGLSAAFLADKPVFAEIVGAFLEFIGTAPLVIHNAGFDLKFLNAELKRIGRDALPEERAIDTLAMARMKFPGSRASLDELCKRFAIDASSRSKHGALIDADLLAQVYLELIGGRQKRFALAPADGAAAVATGPVRQRPEPLPSLLTPQERQAHAAFIAEELGETALWNAAPPSAQ